MSIRVYVDAKIVGRHEADLPKRTLVAYLTENSDELQGVCEVDADETDDAELHAVAFAIQELQGKLKEFTIVCDHESVVSLITQRDRRHAPKRPILSEIFGELERNSSISVELLANNPAHRLLNRYLAEEQIEKHNSSID